ncbi:hypothetical protein GOP47_0025495 [Adiantum capillus-veneris]|uniref:C3H1-type domain-containing protein n=1 Tax=Adiantum capillus-veneris TaxID=13818 RepID=A0A9D4U2V7_ADICA|nr:hypothetical protein GOP47_0025495 [Adiantum capillus-veneris]
MCPRYMAAHHGRVCARRTNNCKFCHFTDLPDCHSVSSHPTDQLRELPLMEDVTSWKESRCSSAVKHIDDHSNLKQTKIRLQSNQASSRRRPSRTEKQIGAGALKTSTQRYVLRPHSSAFHTERDASRLKMGSTFQVDCYQLEHPSFSLANHSWGNSGALINDECLLHHWLSSGVNQKDAYMSIFQGQDSSHACELFHKNHLKKRKSWTSRKNRQLVPQNVEAFWPSISNPSSTYFHHHSLSFKVEKPLLYQEDHASFKNRTEARNLNYDSPCQLPFITKRFARTHSQKLLKQRARLFTRKDLKLSFCDDELNALQLPKGKENKPQRRSFSNSQRRTLANSSKTCPFSDLSKQNQGPSRAVNMKAKSKSKHGPMLEMQNMKGTQAMFAPVDSSTCGTKSYSLDVGGSVNNLDGFSGILAANRQVSKEGSRDSNAEKQVDHGHSNTPSLRFKARTLSQKYRPRMLQDLIGQSIVARALSNAILEGKVAPVYLFQGWHGTGKTSAARIFAMALNCITSEERKPCGKCNECTAWISGNASHVWEVDAASHNGVALMHELIESRDVATPDSRSKIVIIDECHTFSCETWSALMKFSEEPSSNAVFILITTEPDKLPRRVMSRCQRFQFRRITHSDIVNRLDHIAKLENIFTEPGALSLIASMSEGSLRSAETILDQVSLLEQRITLATIHKLVGSVSNDKLIKLLDLALCSDMVRTVQTTKEIVDFGVDPLDLLSQLATLITDILAGSYVPMETSRKEESSMHALSDVEMERLRAALRILSEAERQLRAVSLCRTTWLISALLQLGPRLPRKSQAAILNKGLEKASPVTFKIARGIKLKVLDKGGEPSKRRMPAEAVLGEMTHSIEAPVTDKLSKSDLESLVDSANRLDPPRKPLFSNVEGSSSVTNEELHIHLWSPSNVGSLWLNVLKCCRPSVRHLLENHGKLLALTFSAVNIVAHIVFEKAAEKCTAEMYHVCIIKSFKKVLGPFVQVQFSLASDLQGAGYASCPAAIADALCTQSTLKDNSAYEVYKHQIEKESFGVESPRTPSCPAIAVPPPGSISSCPPLLRVSSGSFCGTETATRKRHCSKSSIPFVKGRFPMQYSDDFCPKDFEGPNASGYLPYKKQTRSSCWRLAKRLLCDCVLSSSINAITLKGTPLKYRTSWRSTEWQGQSMCKDYPKGPALAAQTTSGAKVTPAKKGRQS